MGENLKNRKHALNILNDDGSTAIEKISVLIENKEIHVNRTKTSLKQFYGFDELIKTESESYSFKGIKNEMIGKKRERESSSSE
jgi:glutamate formiminotransferase